MNSDKTNTKRDYDLSIVIPTYQEAANIPLLVPQIVDALKSAGIDGEIIIVDDNSPDETVSICDKLSVDHPLQLLVRKTERGLSSAVLHGMSHARGKVLMVMDADLSHPAEKIPELFQALTRSDDVDFVIGSRYVPGAGTDEDWGFFRWLNSKIATLLARPLTAARDPMAGFFALRKSRFDDAANLDPVGYKIGLELIVKCRCKNISEVPIYFSDRQHGESKLSLKEQLNYLRHLARLYKFKLGRWGQPMQFAMVGATGMVVDLTIFFLLSLLLPIYLGRALSIWTAMSWNFFLNRRVTFPEARQRTAFQQYYLFCGSCLLGAVINWSLFYFLHSSFEFFKGYPILAAFIGVLGGFIFDFLLSKHIAFK